MCTLKNWLWISQGPEKLSLSARLVLGQECKEWGVSRRHALNRAFSEAAPRLWNQLPPEPRGVCYTCRPVQVAVEDILI